MSSKKNIDHFFQDKFQNFEVNPTEEAWMNIEAQLDKKKKRRLIPFWWKLSGVAAVFLLGFFITKSFYMRKDEPTNSVVIESNSIKDTDKINSTKSNHSSSKTIVNLQQTKEKNNALVEANTSMQEERPQSTKTSIKKDNFTTKATRIGYTDSKKYHGKHVKHNDGINSSKTTQRVALNPTKPAADYFETPAMSKQEENISPVYESLKSKGITTEIENNLNSNQNTIAQETTINDTTKIKGVATNPLEELLSEKESKTKQQSKENSWQITSNVAPVFLGSVTNGSPIDPMLKNNDKTFNTSLSMGIGVSYALNDKFTIRTGINKMSFDYDTKGIAFYVDLQENNMANISPSASGKEITIINATTETANLLPFENSFVHKNEGYINQKLGYYEVPVEITYAIINKRFGLKVIGGVSTFFLNENNISVVSESFSTNLGKANNLNNMHFSTNLGLGLKYGFMKSFEFNVEPTLKYQLNTFQSNAGNFKPYVIGIYSGISYKF
jgi:hypothetical protein